MNNLNEHETFMPVYGESVNSITGETIFVDDYGNGNTVYTGADGTKSGPTKLDAMGITQG